MPRKRIDFDELLAVFCWTVEPLFRPTLYQWLESYESYCYRNRMGEFAYRLSKDHWIRRTGTGKQSSYTLGPRGRDLIEGANPETSWNQRWDGVWRGIIFDFRKGQPQGRSTWWRRLRMHKLGMFQYSVWIWPHDVSPVLQELSELPPLQGCFCGAEISKLFLMTDAELVRRSWDWISIGEQHQEYLTEVLGYQRRIGRARDVNELARISGEECRSYRHAFHEDPLLPRALWPKGYAGDGVQEGHSEFGRLAGARFHALTRKNTPRK